ncbi:COMD2 protein, partial [Polyodon spathula]|nr:COMD2 protein [Polyodon spathula]
MTCFPFAAKHPRISNHLRCRQLAELQRNSGTGRLKEGRQWKSCQVKTGTDTNPQPMFIYASPNASFILNLFVSTADERPKKTLFRVWLLPVAPSKEKKMLLVLTDEHKEHLAFLLEVDSAGKLNVAVETVQHGVEGIMYLLTESSKLMISEVDFQDSVLVLGFPEELNKLLLQLYLDNQKEIRNILSELGPNLPHYHNLEWRLDVQLASRALRQQIKPAVTFKLHLEQNGEESANVLQTDPATLLHLIQQLEQALGEMKTTHCRRVVRNIK